MSLILHIQFFMKCYWFYLRNISCIESFSISTASVTLIMPQNYCHSYLLFYISNFFLFSPMWCRYLSPKANLIFFLLCLQLMLTSYRPQYRIPTTHCDIQSLSPHAVSLVSPSALFTWSNHKKLLTVLFTPKAWWCSVGMLPSPTCTVFGHECPAQVFPYICILPTHPLTDQTFYCVSVSFSMSHYNLNQSALP